MLEKPCKFGYHSACQNIFSRGDGKERALERTYLEFSEHPVELLQRLIQFDTTNPPGNECDCITFIAGLLQEHGIETHLFARTPQRPNLVARLPGCGATSPLLLYGHVDVVTVENQDWRYPPFEGRQEDGYIWGRGALDMKGCLSMMLLALLRAAREQARLPGDVILAVVCDEEAGGVFGARYLVEQHPGLFEGVRYALGEFGGFSIQFGKKRFYPIQVAEKQVCCISARLHGPGGHGSLPVRGGAMAGLSRMLDILDRQALPLHITPAARLMFSTIAAGLGGLNGLLLRQLLNPLLADSLLRLLGERGRLFAPLLHNTVSPTMLQGSDQVNVIPAQVTVGLDGRLLPGQSPENLLSELRALLGERVELEVLYFDCGPQEIDLGFYDSLADILKQADPQGIPIPYMLSGVTDARFFCQLGIQTYGFTPMQLPADFKFSSAAHAADERIPVEALPFGSQAIFEALLRPRN